jgi:hypothetical protein
LGIDASLASLEDVLIAKLDPPRVAGASRASSATAA